MLRGPPKENRGHIARRSSSPTQATGPHLSRSVFDFPVSVKQNAEPPIPFVPGFGSQPACRPRLVTFFPRFPDLGVAWLMDVARAHRDPRRSRKTRDEQTDRRAVIASPLGARFADGCEGITKQMLCLPRGSSVSWGGGQRLARSASAKQDRRRTCRGEERVLKV